MRKSLLLRLLSTIVITAQMITAVMVCIDASMKVYDSIKARIEKKKKGKIGFAKT